MTMKHGNPTNTSELMAKHVDETDGFYVPFEKSRDVMIGGQLLFALCAFLIAATFISAFISSVLSYKGVYIFLNGASVALLITAFLLRFFLSPDPKTKRGIKLFLIVLRLPACLLRPLSLLLNLTSEFPWMEFNMNLHGFALQETSGLIVLSADILLIGHLIFSKKVNAYLGFQGPPKKEKPIQAT